MSEWQPIDTAPKGGGAEYVTDPEWVDPPQILLLFESKDISVAHWDWAYAPGGYHCTDGVAWIEPCSGESLNLYYGKPTHWMPLPSPPKK